MDRELLLEKYLMKDLNDAEWHQFKTMLDSDEDFKDEVEIRSVLYADYKTDLKKELLENRAKLKASVHQVSKVRKLLIPALSIAAIMVLGIASLFLFQLSNNKDLNTLTSEYINELPPSPTILMGKNERDNQYLMAANEAYQNSQYIEAASFFEKIEQPGSLEHFYLGLSYLYQTPRLTQKAIQNFEKVIEIPNNFTEEALWYIGLSHLLQNDKAAARSYLIQIKRNSTNYENAAHLLKKITQNL